MAPRNPPHDFPLERTVPGPIAEASPPAAVRPPALACDAHCHIFGPAERFPFSPTRTYTPPDSGIDDFERLQRRLGLERAVFVQASCHGADNSAMLDAIERGAGRYAGVAMIDPSFTDDDLAELHEHQVRGIRFNFVAHLGGAPDLDEFRDLVHRVAALRWHVVLHLDARDFGTYSGLLDAMPVPYVIDHMARVPAADGVDQEPFQRLLERLASDERCWVKVSCAERLTEGRIAPYDDVVPFGRALVECAPDRVLWGTDWPHPNLVDMPDEGRLLDLLAAFAPDQASRDRILVDNPQVLYDFS
ncbi:MAG: amidohydrolase family protein [Ilumatobacter sp.]|uniref:amidohydrolase family protein n=1 Tax=Ilumatobacter sp. TaxID=1967498 RepID=UPI002630B326|nr:amidohydrolase family protein [Ilumatobacter sp.]MDJ0767349.1 amidohydrolase family protein [Ilumatobacter sp.]